MAPELPGFYYDEEKKRYFKIVNGSKNSSTDKYHNNNVQAQNRRKDFEINSTRKIRRKDVSSIGKGKLWAVNRVQEALIRQERGQVEIHQGNYLQDPISLKLQTQGANFNFPLVFIQKNFVLVGQEDSPRIINNVVYCRQWAVGESEVADGEDEPVAWEDIGELLIYQIAKQGYIQEYFPLPEFAKTHFLTEQDGGYVSHKESPRWYGVFHNMSEDLDDEDHFMQFRTMSSYVKDDYLCFLATCFIDSPEHGSISIVIYEAKQSYEDDTIDLMKLIYRGFTEGMENRAKINALFGAERFIEGGQNALLMNNDGGYYVTTSHISDKGIVCMGTNHGEVLTIRTVLSDVEVKPPILKKYFRNPISCICSKAISNTEDMIFIADTTGDCLLFTSSRLESQIPSSKTKRIGLKIGCKVTNAFFCDGFLIVIGLKKVGKYDFNGKIQQNVKYLNNNLTNQASCFFNFKYLALETNIIIINESNHELRLYDVLSGQTIKIELEVPQTYTLKTMVIMKNRLRVFFAEGSQGKIRDYELFKHFRDTIS